MSYLRSDFPHTHFYESDLRELIAFYKELQDKYNGLVADIQALKEWKTQHEGEYEALLERVQTVEGEIENFEAEVETKFEELSRTLDQRFTQLSSEIRQELADTISEINRQFNALRREIENEIAQMKLEISALEYDLAEAIANFREEMAAYLDERFELFIQSLPDYEHLIVHNPVRGYDTTVQVALDDLYASFNVFGLTAAQFDEIGLACQEFDDRELTAHEFDSMGYKLLGYPDPDYYMRDPFSGEIIPIKDVVMKLFALHAGTLTVNDFEALDLTCAEFDAKETTAFNFDFFGISA